MRGKRKKIQGEVASPSLKRDAGKAPTATEILDKAEQQVPRAELFPKQEEANTFLAQPGRWKGLYGGSRAGKTFLFCRAICTRALYAGGSRHAVLRLRANAVRSSISLDTLPKVMRTCYPGVAIEEHKMDGFFEFPHNKSQIWVGGLDDKERVEKILGQEYATIFLNEASQIPYSSVLIAQTRLAQVIEGLTQRMYVDLNPPSKDHWSHLIFQRKMDPITRKPLADAHEYASMQMNPVDNPHLDAAYMRSLENLPERYRRRFYLGEYLEEVEGALWKYDRLDAIRIELQDLPALRRIVVAVDPSGARGDEDVRSNEIGIIVAGLGWDGIVYVLEDLSCREGPSVWSKIAVNAFHRWHADSLVAELNFGKAMVEETIRAVDPLIPLRVVTASRGKAVRAEPAATLYEERIDRVRHVGRFAELEDQLCAFSVAGYSGEKSPDRADALIWAISDLAIGAAMPQLLFG